MSRVANEGIVLERGAKDPEVGNLQRFLSELGYRDVGDSPLAIDEAFGPNTEHALRTFQRTTALSVTGKLDGATRRAIVPLGFIPFVQSKSCRIFWPKRRPVRAIVIHTMECQESSLTAAEDVALWFAGKTAYPAPKASAHYCVDQDSTVQCVRDTDEAWHANQGNITGIGIEHAGFASQSPEAWSDDVSSAILWRSARLAGRLSRLYGIPPAKLSEPDLVAGRPGFTGHVDVNHAYGNRGGHTDPGPNFPWAMYLSLVQESM